MRTRLQKERESVVKWVEDEREAELLKLCRHPHVIGYIQHGVEDGRVFLEMERAERDLAGVTVDEATAWNWLAQLCLGLGHLHQLEVIHGDIKPSNLLEREGVVKLADFGIARLAGQTDRPNHATPYYMSPEIIEGLAPTFKSDIWMLGCTLYQLLEGGRPFRADSLQRLSLQILKQQPQPMASGVSESLRKLIYRMLSKIGEDRPSTAAILESPECQRSVALMGQSNRQKEKKTVGSRMRGRQGGKVEEANFLSSIVERKRRELGSTAL